MAEQTPEPQQKRRADKQSIIDVLFAPLLALGLCAVLVAAAWMILPHLGSASSGSETSQAQNTAPASSGTELTTTSSETTATTTFTTAEFPPAASRTEPVSTSALPEQTQAANLSTEAVSSTAASAQPAQQKNLLIARNALLIRADEAGSTVLYEKASDTRMYPASMTKIMTLVTFLDLMPEIDLNTTIKMSGKVIAAQQAKYAYVTGFKANEECTVKDLIYAMMLPSGADAAAMLATYAAGSEDAFAEKMNALAERMGLQDSHFVNCTGLHSNNHYSTAHDISRILMYALRNPIAKEAMSTRKYTTSKTAQHPNGIQLVSTTLSRLVGNELSQMSVPLTLVGGKTGYTTPAGQCLATWAVDANNNTYICIIAGSTEKQPLDAMGDTLTLYQLVSEPMESISRIQPVAANLPDYVH